MRLMKGKPSDSQMVCLEIASENDIKWETNTDKKDPKANKQRMEFRFNVRAPFHKITKLNGYIRTDIDNLQMDYSLGKVSMYEAIQVLDRDEQELMNLLKKHYRKDRKSGVWFSKYPPNE